MIRLAVSATGTVSSELARRLQGVVIEAADPGVDPSCTAVAFLDPREQAAERAERCLESGQDVLLLPGRWLTETALERLSTVGHGSGAVLHVLNPERFVSSRTLIHERLESGRLGTPGLVRLHRWSAGSQGADTDISLSLVLDLDVVVWLMGQGPERVYAVEVPGGQGALTGRAILLHLGFPSGGMALIDRAEWSREGDSYQSLSVIASEGATYADDHQNMQLLFDRSGAHALRVEEQVTALVGLVQSFVDDLLEGHADVTEGGASWKRVLRVAQAARRSLASGQAMAVEP